jgi:1-acyl-sn-glycerol-3-phosphate acyltransferase
LSNPQPTLPEKAATSSKSGGLVLPQWFLNFLKYLVRVLSRLFWRIKYQGLENIPADDGVLVAANHQSYFDPFWLGAPFKRPLRFLAWNNVFDWAFVGKFMGLLGAWPLQIEGSDPRAIRRSLQWLKNGGAVVIFPEGGRGLPDGSLLRFKGGAVRLALEADVPILPVTIRGGHKVWPSSRRLPRGGQVEIIFHPLHYVNQLPDEEARACARRESDVLAGIIDSAL